MRKQTGKSQKPVKQVRVNSFQDVFDMLTEDHWMVIASALPHLMNSKSRHICAAEKDLAAELLVMFESMQDPEVMHHFAWDKVRELKDKEYDRVERAANRLNLAENNPRAASW